MTLIDAPAVPSTPRHKDLQNLSAREIAARITARELSSAAVVEHFVARLKAVNVKLNAVTADLSESSRKVAEDVDNVSLAAMAAAAAQTQPGYPTEPPL
jgi:Asp-tRNA(Asn)/Glu-tRNA(Gln) amidotransferase A subunit family amidase